MLFMLLKKIRAHHSSMLDLFNTFGLLCTDVSTIHVSTHLQNNLVKKEIFFRN